jgi:hypothetical protein
MPIEFWQRKCPICHALLEKDGLSVSWKCWSCAWTTEDISRGHQWDGVSQKPHERAWGDR